jgi:hypothetical protein
MDVEINLRLRYFEARQAEKRYLNVDGTFQSVS